MAKIARSETITIRGDGSATKDYLFINDFSNACAQLLAASAPPPAAERIASNDEPGTTHEQPGTTHEEPRTPNPGSETPPQQRACLPAKNANNPHPSRCHSNILKNVSISSS
jgi:hypothetical protein